MKKILPLLSIAVLLLLVGIVVGAFVISNKPPKEKVVGRSPEELAKRYEAHSYPPIPNPSPKPTPSPRALTFAEMNVLYGPCVYLPTLFYHHIQDSSLAKQKGQQNLTVDTKNFIGQMQYLKAKGYQTQGIAELLNFFDNGVGLPTKSILLTFDDAYGDFSSNAYPILSQLGFKSVMFTPTGLVGNPGYLSWDQIGSMTSNVTFANHTWSHKSMTAGATIDEKEISTADSQLSEHGLNNPKSFAYPYGTVTEIAKGLLTKYGYTLGFTTRPGSVLCKKQRLELPRVRIGNGSLSSYGF